MDHDAPEAREAADHATSRSSRRALLGLGIGGAAASLLPFLSGRASATDTTMVTSAAPATTAPPKRPTDADKALLGAAQQVELAAVELYTLAIGTVNGWTAEQATVMTTFRDAHRAYADSLSAILGRTAPGTASADVISAFRSAFSGSPADVCVGAWTFESAAVATHSEVLGALQGLNGAALTASIQIAEARHCTVLADLAGLTDAASLLVDAEEAPIQVNG